jgi:hypothetical protein
MNYFLEDIIGSILKKSLNMHSCSDVRRMLMEQLPFKGTKYMNLLNAYEDKIIQCDKIEEYKAKLVEILERDNKH